MKQAILAGAFCVLGAVTAQAQIFGQSNGSVSPFGSNNAGGWNNSTPYPITSRPNPIGGYDYSNGVTSRPNPLGGMDFSNGMSCHPNPLGGMDCR